MVKIVVSVKTLWVVGVFFAILMLAGVYALVDPGHSMGELQSTCDGLIVGSGGVFSCIQGSGIPNCNGANDAITFDLNTNSFVCTTAP